MDLTHQTPGMKPLGVSEMEEVVEEGAEEEEEITVTRPLKILMEVLAVPPLFLQESSHSGGIPVDSSGTEFGRRPC